MELVDSTAKPGAKSEALSGEKEEEKKPKIFTWSFSPSKVALTAHRENKEDPNSNLIDTHYTYSLKLDPLFGVKAEVDVLLAMIELASTYVPGAGAVEFLKFVNMVLVKGGK